MTRTRTSSWAAGAAALALAAASGAALAADPPEKPEASKRQCFFTNTVNSYSVKDDETVHVRVGVKDVYRLDLMGRCPDIDWNNRIALVSRGGSSICSGLDATIITKGPFGPQRCPVRMVTKLTPEEAAALKAKP